MKAATSLSRCLCCCLPRKTKRASESSKEESDKLLEKKEVATLHDFITDNSFVPQSSSLMRVLQIQICERVYFCARK